MSSHAMSRTRVMTRLKRALEATVEQVTLIKREKRHEEITEIKVEKFVSDATQEVRQTVKSEKFTEATKNEKLTPQTGVKTSGFLPAAGCEPGQPKDWHLIYNEIIRMRALITTPVDTMGCELMPNTVTPGLRHSDPKAYRFQLLISLMLLSQTKDETTFAAIRTLNEHFSGKGFPGLCLEAILGATEAEIDGCICKVGFHRRKAMYIKKSIVILNEEHAGDIPKTIEEIVKLPGVGPKMGHLLLQSGWGINSGIGVDVHLHRLAQMWGWVKKSEDPEKTRKELELWLPREHWADVNPLLVGFGQVVCVPKASNCDICTISKCKGRKKFGGFDEKRLAKLGKQRGDVSALVRLAMET